MGIDIACMCVRFGKYQDQTMCARSDEPPGVSISKVVAIDAFRHNDDDLNHSIKWAVLVI